MFLYLEGGTIRNNNNDDLYINERIREREVRVIGADGQMLGIMSSMEARRLAEEAELDLVMISPAAKPPVCKIIDYGKFKYEKTRKEKESKRKQHMVEIKEIRMSPNIDTNDMQTKINAARKRSKFVAGSMKKAMRFCFAFSVLKMLLHATKTATTIHT